MNNFARLRSSAHSIRQGAMLVLIAVVMIIFIVATVFSVDIAYMFLVKAEMRTATDAAARAGAGTLARTQDQNSAVDAAMAIAERNRVAGDGLTLRRQDVLLGGVNENGNGKFEFARGQQPLTSVSVTGRRDDSAPDSTVPLFFAGVLGVEQFRPVENSQATSSVRDIALILDRSGSMNSPTGSGTRLTALVAAVNVFLNEIDRTSPNSAVSLTTYSTDATRDIPLTENFAQVRADVANLRAQGLTNIFDALRKGSDSLIQDRNAREFAEKTIVLMTDGNFNRGGSPNPSARRAARRDQTIHTITFSSGANQQAMRDVARIGGGIHVHADNAGDLADAFREIAETLSVALIK